MTKQFDNPLQIMNIKNKYLDTNKLNMHFSQTKDCQLKIIHLNIRSLPDKFDKLKLFLNNFKHKPDLILLCETFLNENNKNLYELEGFNFANKNRLNKTGGGVGIYINKEIPYKILDDLSSFHEGIYESIFIEANVTVKKNLL